MGYISVDNPCAALRNLIGRTLRSAELIGVTDFDCAGWPDRYFAIHGQDIPPPFNVAYNGIDAANACAVRIVDTAGATLAFCAALKIRIDADTDISLGGGPMIGPAIPVEHIPICTGFADGTYAYTGALACNSSRRYPGLDIVANALIRLVSAHRWRDLDGFLTYATSEAAGRRLVDSWHYRRLRHLSNSFYTVDQLAPISMDCADQTMGELCDFAKCALIRLHRSLPIPAQQNDSIRVLAKGLRDWDQEAVIIDSPAA